MPNRLIKESIHDSEDVNKMSDFEFRLWVNLIAYVDDYGRGDARPEIIKGKCFPLRDEIKPKLISQALKGLEAIGAIRTYSVKGKAYLYFPTWDLHQRIRTKKSKFPAPQTVDSNPPQIAADCGDLQQTAAKCARAGAESESESKYESESESKYESESESKYESESKGESKGESKPKACPSEHSDVFEMFSAGDEVLLLALKDFDKMRTRIKKPMTDKARELLTRKLQEFKREDWVDVLNQSVYQGWAGIYPINTDKEKKRGKKVVTFMDV